MLRIRYIQIMTHAGPMDALKRAMNFVGFSLFFLYIDIHKFSFQLILMEFILILYNYAS